ncbi:MAG: hypothetical protein U5R06_15020 [candidate division KSB1 bacterium]|nr:hypothetical protein [candidate division KSB1 bacterium]
METITGTASTLYQWITSNPFDTLFIVMDLLFLYCFAAGWGFVTSSEHTVKGPARFFRGRALNRSEATIHYDERERAGNRLLVIGLVCLLALFFIPLRFSFWIKLLLIIASVVVSLLLAAVWGTRYKMKKHMHVHSDRVDSARQKKHAALLADRRREALRYLSEGFDTEQEFLRAAQIYGQKRLLQAIDLEIDRTEFSHSRLESIAANLRGGLKAQQRRTATLDELVPGGAAAYARILQGLSDPDRERAEFLLKEILDRYVDFRRKDEYRKEFKNLVRGGRL